MTEQEMLQQLEEVKATQTATNETLVKIGTETSNTLTQVESLNTKVAELEAIIANGGGVSQEIQDKVAEIKSGAAAALDSAKAVDALVPDEQPVVDTHSEENTNG